MLLCLLWLRVVRHLPVQHHKPAHDNGLRAGVGQASKEETAECSAADWEGYGPMGIRDAWRELAPMLSLGDASDGVAEAQQIKAVVWVA